MLCLSIDTHAIKDIKSAIEYFYLKQPKSRQTLASTPPPLPTISCNEIKRTVNNFNGQTCWDNIFSFGLLLRFKQDIPLFIHMGTKLRSVNLLWKLRKITILVTFQTTQTTSTSSSSTTQSETGPAAAPPPPPPPAPGAPAGFPAGINVVHGMPAQMPPGVNVGRYEAVLRHVPL